MAALASLIFLSFSAALAGLSSLAGLKAIDATALVLNTSALLVPKSEIQPGHYRGPSIAYALSSVRVHHGDGAQYLRVWRLATLRLAGPRSTP